MRLFIAFLFPVIILLFSTSAGAATSGGIIHFYGAIVEGGCDHHTHEQQLQLSCPQGQKVVTRQFSFRDIAGQSFASLSKIEMHYINPERTKGIVVMSYY
ncbi:type 1 fimbrial protein [Kosakonia oryziphila]|jgi:hypothetical protein|uniref:Type 1 fimbrial protein n=1 Tax=Kosakonia oryziphila TaxID=1005667 RepID=A0A1C4EIA4_9ENTR|nr:type 1 fimbrial protein [Kosakonia oryziphila]SCC43317.1 hypothetical protein GA0061070_102374 [Kosakonia oryziphila]